MQQLYPAISPYATHMITTGQGHAIYVEQTGNPEGIPVLFIHGGPGAGLGQDYRRFFDPQRYRIIGLDQRGCGQSLPFGELTENTTQRLIEDVFAIQADLQIERWLLFGGSWGSTLALLLAIARPQAISGLILRGIFLARQQDCDWFLAESGGAAQLFPDYYQEFLQPLKHLPQPCNIVDAYYDIFAHGDEVTKMAAIKSWYLWEARISRLHVQADEHHLIQDVHTAISLALLECHYIKHQCFIEENYILNNLAVISHLPVHIIHGCYDMVCKLEAAYSLHQGLQNSQLTIVPEAGHSAFEVNIAAALCCASKAMAEFIKEQQ